MAHSLLLVYDTDSNPDEERQQLQQNITTTVAIDNDVHRENTSNEYEIVPEDNICMLDEQLEEYSATRAKENTIQDDGLTDDANMSDPEPPFPKTPFPHRPSPDPLPTPSTETMPEANECRLTIASLCNPNDEVADIWQPQASSLFSNNLDAVCKPSWIKDSSCKQ